MMTGAILGGASISQAVKYQQIIMFLISATTTLAVTLAATICMIVCIDSNHRCRNPIPSQPPQPNPSSLSCLPSRNASSFVRVCVPILPFFWSYVEAYSRRLRPDRVTGRKPWMWRIRDNAAKSVWRGFKYVWRSLTCRAHIDDDSDETESGNESER
jgi:hypothetical protein